jgi:hypothetical protein
MIEKFRILSILLVNLQSFRWFAARYSGWAKGGNRMKRLSVVAVAAMVMGAAPAAKDPPPIANYWMDVATTSGMGAGMTPGGRPNMGQIMSMMSGGGGSVGHTLDLRLASRTKAPASPEADHLIPAGLQMGSSLPLLTPTVVKEERAPTGMPTNFPQPKGRMLIYWGCGEHVGAPQPTVIDFAKVAAGQVPPGMAAMASMAHLVTGPTSAPGFGRWPNQKDSRAVPAQGSLVGAHKVEANYAPPIGFSLGAGQDFMAPLNLAEAGPLPSGATPLRWQPASNATGYALALFGASPNGDVGMWSSASKATMPALDYVGPSEVRRLIGTGAVLPPTTSQCLLPAEVAAAVPMGMVTMIGYGPEAYFEEKPKAPTWTTRVRYKTTASLMHGMGGMMGGAMTQGAPEQQPQAGQEPPKKKKKFGIGDLLGGSLPVPH